MQIKDTIITARKLYSGMAPADLQEHRLRAEKALGEATDLTGQEDRFWRILVHLAAMSERERELGVSFPRKEDGD